MQLYLAVRGSREARPRLFPLEVGQKWQAGRYMGPFVKCRYLRDQTGPLEEIPEYFGPPLGSEPQAQEYIRRALRLLERAADKGYFKDAANVGELKTDADFDAVRSHADFPQL